MMNKFEEMMAPMMEMMMEKMAETMMTTMMNTMMGSMMTAVTPDKQEVQPVKKAKVMTKEEFFALEEEPVKSSKDYSSLDFEPVNAKSLRYNGYIRRDLWVANHLEITNKYNGKWNGKTKSYTFPTHADAVNFAQSYKIKTELTDTDKHNVKQYEIQREKAKAEYHAKKAAEMK